RRRGDNRPRHQSAPSRAPAKKSFWQKITALFTGGKPELAARPMAQTTRSNGSETSRSPRKPESVEVTTPRLYVGNLSFDAAESARRLNAEIISADAFQIYRGLDLLTAKPEKTTLAKAPHYLLSMVPLSEKMNAEKFRAAAVEAIRDIHARGKHAMVVGGSGL